MPGRRGGPFAAEPYGYESADRGGRRRRAAVVSHTKISPSKRRASVPTMGNPSSWSTSKPAPANRYHTSVYSQRRSGPAGIGTRVAQLLLGVGRHRVVPRL